MILGQIITILCVSPNGNFNDIDTDAIQWKRIKTKDNTAFWKQRMNAANQRQEARIIDRVNIDGKFQKTPKNKQQ